MNFKGIMARRALVAALCIAPVCLALTACEPVPAKLDDPKDGDKIEIGVKQTLTFRLTNGQPDTWAWKWEEKPLTALTSVGAVAKPPSDAGGLQTETFAFVGKTSGKEAMTFTYAPKDGSQAAGMDRITITVSVK
jgi:hypothetical protein